MARIRIAWFQYRLRTLLVVIAIIAIWLGVIGQRAWRQKYVVDRIRSLGGTVAYDFQKQKGGRWNEFDLKNSPPGPGWLRRFIGDDYFETVVQIDFSKMPITDGDLAVLDNLPNANALECICFDYTKISNDGLAHIERFGGLYMLSLWHTGISDRGLIHLRNLTGLRDLVLDNTEITDAGMVNLDGMVNLEDWLGLTDTQITDASVKYFKNFKKLREINLLRTKITERGARELKQALPRCFISYSINGYDRNL